MSIVKTRQSDKSSKVMKEDEGANIRVTFYDGKTTALKADLTAAEVAEILPFAKAVSERPNGRGPRKGKDEASTTPEGK